MNEKHQVLVRHYENLVSSARGEVAWQLPTPLYRTKKEEVKLKQVKLIAYNGNLAVVNGAAIKDEIKEIPGRSWNSKRRIWELPPNYESFRKVLAIAPNIIVGKGVKELLEKRKAEEAEVLRQREIPWQEQKAIRKMPIKVKPFQHQIAGYNVVGSIFGLWGTPKNAGAGLYMEQGTGKTLTTIALAGRMFLDNIIARMLVVAPASVVPVWPQEFKSFAAFPCDVRPLEGASSKRAETLRNWMPSSRYLQVAVINYESTWRIDKAILDWKPDLVVLDESQRIKSPGAKQSKFAHKLGKVTPYRLILTGTPVTQGPLDFYSQLKFADPRILGSSYVALKSRYAIMGGFENRQILGYKNLPELTQKVHSIGFRVTKEEALDLPEQVDQVRYCELEGKAKSTYQRLLKESVAELSGGKVIVAQNVLARLLRLSQLAGGFYSEAGEKPIKVSDAKLKLLEEVLNDLGDQKVVIFARFLAEIEAIKGLLESRKTRYQFIDGSVPLNERGEVVREFQEEPDCKVFVAQIQTAGLGITLHAASVAVFYSLDYSFANLDQARARLHRIGQKNAVTNIYLITKGTVDTKVFQALGKKQDVARLVVDNWKLLFEEGVT